MGLTNFSEVEIFKGFKPNEVIFGAEVGLLTKEPYLLSVGFINWSPQQGVDPQPFLEADYYTEHSKLIGGVIHAGSKTEAILGYVYDFNKTWRMQVDFQSGQENSSTLGITWNITPDFQVNPAVYLPNYHPGENTRVYRFHLYLSSLGRWSKMIVSTGLAT